MPGGPSLQVLNREECHLCEELEAFLRRLGLPYVTLDVDSDPELVRLYGEAVPVLFRDGAEIARAPIDERALRAALAQSSAPPYSR
jgi:glutaredoxin